MQLRSRAALVVALGLAVIAVVTLGRAVTAARAELQSARSYRDEAQPARATEHYRRSLRWSFPFTPYVAPAASELATLAEGLEAEGDPAGALLAWRSLAGGLAASRFIYSGADPARERAKGQIARLLALEGGAAIDANLTPEKLAADHRRLLDEEVAPHPVWGTLLLAGFALWLVSLLLIIQRGFDVSGKLVWPTARGPLSGAFVGLLSFVLGLLFA
jgi:hypothetical protein